MKVVIVGAGGHGQVVADILLAMDDMQPVAFVDESEELHGKYLLGIKVEGSLDALESIEHDAVILAVGDNAARCALYAKLTSRGEKFCEAIHPDAVLGTDVYMGPGVMVCAGVVVNAGARIERCAILNTGSSVDHHCRVGPFAHIGPGARLAGNVDIGGEAFVGIGAAIINNISVGRSAIIGAGAAVIENVDDNTTVGGVPAKKLEH